MADAVSMTIKPKCSPNADARKITREEHEDARQVARDIAKTEQYEISMKLRRKVEMARGLRRHSCNSFFKTPRV